MASRKRGWNPVFRPITRPAKVSGADHEAALFPPKAIRSRSLDLNGASHRSERAVLLSEIENGANWPENRDRARYFFPVPVANRIRRELANETDHQGILRRFGAHL